MICIQCEKVQCRRGRFRCDACQTESDAKRGHALPPPELITEKFNPVRKGRVVPIQSNRQRTIVITFESVADAEAWDELDDTTAVAAMIDHPYSRSRPDHSRSQSMRSHPSAQSPE